MSNIDYDYFPTRSAMRAPYRGQYVARYELRQPTRHVPAKGGRR